jgi:hypothetical protein
LRAAEVQSAVANWAEARTPHFVEMVYKPPDPVAISTTHN